MAIGGRGTTDGAPDPSTPTAAAGPLTWAAAAFGTATAVVLPVGYAPSFGFEGHAFRWAFGILLGAVGCAGLVLWPRRDLAANLALAFLAAAALATILSPAPVSSALGRGTWFVGLLAIIAFVGSWAVGRAARPRASLLIDALLVGTALNAAAGLLQALQLHPLNVPDSSDFGRAAGLVGNPVHLAALSAAGLTLAARQAGRVGRWPYYLGIGTLSLGVNLAGGRAGIATAVVGLVLALALRPPPMRRVAGVLASVALGVALSIGVAQVSETGTATSRRVDLSARGRPGAWKAGVEAAVERPLLGWGPGRFGAESTSRRSLESRQAELAVFEDAHNWPIELLATVGFVGSGLLLLWLLASAREARGPLALFALVLAANGLLQPMSIAVTPLAALALGGASLRGPPTLTRWRPPALAAAAAAAAVVAVLFAVGQREASRIEPTSSGLQAFDRARRLLPDSPELLSSGLRARFARGGPEDLRAASRLADRITELEPGIAAYWNASAAVAVAEGDEDDARRRYQRALEEDPWSVDGLRGLAAVTASSDPATSQAACGRLARVLPRGSCP